MRATLPDPEKEIVERARVETLKWRSNNFRRTRGRNHVVGRVTDIGVDGLQGQVTISAGSQRIPFIICADAVRGMRLKDSQSVAPPIKSTAITIIRP